MVGLNRPWDVLLADEVGAEEHEGVWWTWDVALGAALSRRRPTTCRSGSGSFGWRKQRVGGRWEICWGIVAFDILDVCSRGYVGCKGDVPW